MDRPKKTVLIVDDEPQAREALARLIESHGHYVLTAGDSQQAMQIVANETINVVLLDLDLPHVPGDSLAAFLHMRYPKSRIIFMSGQYDMINPQRFGENTSYFRKPLDINMLLETLESEGTTAAAS